ncbi:Uncharacterised protein [Mycobacteroides abscessus]|nr:Uncharacterised protein [Mycobacteroides abscessus]
MASFLDLFPAIDSFGARAARYKLYYLGGYAHLESWIFGMLTGLLYVGYKYATVTANGLLGLVLSSGSWLEPLSQAYQRVTAPLYAFAPPWAIACGGMAIVGFSVMLSRPKTTAGGFFDSASLNRIHTGLAMMAMVIILTHDPFAAIMKVLEAANSLSVSGSAALTHSANDTTITAGQSLVDNSIRTPTIALNYGGEFSDDCEAQFSKAMQEGHALSESSGCFVQGQNVASPDTAGTALVMLFLPALPMLVFAVIGAWKYVLHLTMSVMCAVALAWVAASSVHKRRGFEQLSETFARAGAHLLMAVITSVVAVGLPSLVSGLATKLLGLSTDADLQVFVLMVSMGIGFMVSTYVIYRITSKHGALVRILKADANTTLNRTLGIDTRPLQLEINRLNPFSKRFGEKEAASPLAAPSTVLASNPLAVQGEEGAAAVKRQPSAKDAADVEQLLAPAESVAAAAGEPDTREPVHVVLPQTVSQNADSRAWQQALSPDPGGDRSLPTYSGTSPPRLKTQIYGALKKPHQTMFLRRGLQWHQPRQIGRWSTASLPRWVPQTPSRRTWPPRERLLPSKSLTRKSCRSRETCSPIPRSTTPRAAPRRLSQRRTSRWRPSDLDLFCAASKLRSPSTQYRSAPRRWSTVQP